LSRESRAGVETFLDLWQTMGASAWYELWLGEIERLRGNVARLLGCGTHEIAIMPNVSAGLSAVASAVEYRGRNRILCAELDFPTVPYQWLARVRDGAEVVLAPSPDGISLPEETWDELLDENTAFLAVSHVFFTTGWVNDLAAIGSRVQDVGGLFIVDAYQSAGIFPLPVKELGVDVLLSGGLKWLLGGPGIAWMYVREELHEWLDPRATGWFAAENQFAFDPADRSLRSDARRLEGGTPSPGAVYAARAGLDLVLEYGVHELGARTRALVNLLVTMAAERGLEARLPADPERRSGIVILPDDDPPATVRALAADGIIVDARPTGVRVSPYAYNTPHDLEVLLDAMDRIRAD
jgi:selenocysteine lyase/cysteine desulfurase